MSLLSKRSKAINPLTGISSITFFSLSVCVKDVRFFFRRHREAAKLFKQGTWSRVYFRGQAVCERRLAGGEREARRTVNTCCKSPSEKS